MGESEDYEPPSGFGLKLVAGGRWDVGTIFTKLCPGGNKSPSLHTLVNI